MKALTTVLVLGSQGQLGLELHSLSLRSKGFHFLFLDRTALDINDTQCGLKIKAMRPDVVINAAAYTAVDKAEQEILLAMQANAYAVARIAVACNEINALLIHISSDYVYHSGKSIPMDENVTTAPKNIYAISKLYGEKMATYFNAKTVVIRSSWIYSIYGNNFVKTMLKLAATKKSLKIVNDQFGAPTNAKDLADAILKIVTNLIDNPDQEAYGIYNYANEGYTTWMSFAQTIFASKELEVEVLPCTTKDYNAPALRPAWSVMQLDKIKNKFGLTIPHWKDSLTKMLKDL